MKKKLVVITILICAFNVLAGGGPLSTLVVVNQQSVESMEVGNYYAELRGIPQANICPISVDPLVYRLGGSNLLESVITGPIENFISAQGLDSQINAIVLSKDIPYAVKSASTTAYNSTYQNGTTAGVFYGWRTPAANCSLVAGTASHYFKAERSLRHSDSYDGANYYLCSMLTAADLSGARDLAERGVLADGVFPEGTNYLLKTTDANRNVRYQRFDEYNFMASLAPNASPRVFHDGNTLPSGTSEVMGYFTGLSSIYDVASPAYLPGAICDHLTSFGGMLYDATSQMQITEWTAAGASASYGTVIEACNYLEKFPDPMLYYWQGRGFSNGEAYWMSVENPYQGIFIGDPLAAPFAAPPSVQFVAPVADAVVSGNVPIQITAGTNSLGDRSAVIDLFIDGVFLQTITNVAPTVGQTLTFSTSAHSRDSSYTVQSGDDLYDVASGLADEINATRNGRLDAEAAGDRVMLRYETLGVAGDSLTYSLSGGNSTLSSWQPSSTLTESTALARQRIVLQGSVTTTGTQTIAITLGNGTSVPVSVAVTAGDSFSTVMTSLKGAINANATLQGTAGIKAEDQYNGSTLSYLFLETREGGPDGYNCEVAFSPVTGLSGGIWWDNGSLYSSRSFDYNDEVLSARGLLLLQCGEEPLTGSVQWDSTAVANGEHILQAVARLGTAPATEGLAQSSITVSNAAFRAFLTAPESQIELGETLDLQATGVDGTVTQATFYVQGKEVVSGTSLIYQLDSSAYGVGMLEAQVLLESSGSDKALSDVLEIAVDASYYHDSDSDGLGDRWEQDYWGTIHAQSGIDDSDTDERSNQDEYTALTDPTDDTDFLQVEALTTGSSTELSFFSHTNRLYSPEFVLTATNSNWAPAVTAFPGIGAVTNWLDPAQNIATQRFYRIRVDLP